MLRKSALIAAAWLLPIPAAMAGEDPFKADLSSMNLPNLISLFVPMNDQCRGGSGDNPDTQRYCDRRDAVYKEVQRRGWCWGPDDVAGADKSWVACQKPTQSASSIPRFDAAAQCRNVSSTGGAPSETIYASCMEMEQSAYNQLKPSWDQIPASMQTHCTMVAKTGGAGSYMILQTCIEQELEAKKTNSGTTFNY